MNRILNESWLSASAKIIFRISLNNNVSVELPVIGDHLTLSWPNGYVISKTDDKRYTCVMQRPCSFNSIVPCCATSHNQKIYWLTFVDGYTLQLHQPRLWFITGGYLVKRWFLPAAARARGQSNNLNREILASNLFNCRKEVINAPPVPSVSRCIHIVYRHKNIWEYQWSNFIYNCMSTFLHYVRCKDALLDCSAPGGERCESLTGVDEIAIDNVMIR